MSLNSLRAVVTAWLNASRAKRFECSDGLDTEISKGGSPLCLLHFTKYTQGAHIPTRWSRPVDIYAVITMFAEWTNYLHCDFVSSFNNVE